MLLIGVRIKRECPKRDGYRGVGKYLRSSGRDTGYDEGQRTVLSVLYSPLPYFTGETQVAPPRGLVKLTTADRPLMPLMKLLRLGCNVGYKNIT